MKKTITLLVVSLCIASGIYEAIACSRVAYSGSKAVATGRTMDWDENTKSDFWLFPRGIERSGKAGPNSLEWTSKYGSVILSAYDIATIDGMNEAGVVANLLWLHETKCPEWNPSQSGLSMALWPQYILDNFATVKEAVEVFASGKIQVLTDKLPGTGLNAVLHLSISDATGDNAIMEYVGGELKIHHNTAYKVMTNSPTYDQHLAQVKYWQNIGGFLFLPGTYSSSDRFARASHYVNILPQELEPSQAVAGVFSIIRNTSVPFGIRTEKIRNISHTLWRVVANQTDKVLYYESTDNLNLFWIEFKDLDFSEGSEIKKLPVSGGEQYYGNAAVKFKAEVPFVFFGI